MIDMFIYLVGCVVHLRFALQKQFVLLYVLLFFCFLSFFSFKFFLLFFFQIRNSNS